MDTDWCLYCEKHTKGGALYCSAECMKADGASPSLPPLPSSSSAKTSTSSSTSSTTSSSSTLPSFAGFYIGDSSSFQAPALNGFNSANPVVFSANVLQSLNQQAGYLNLNLNPPPSTRYQNQTLNQSQNDHRNDHQNQKGAKGPAPEKGQKWVTAAQNNTIRRDELPPPLTAAVTTTTEESAKDLAPKTPRTYAEVTRSNPASRKNSASSLLTLDSATSSPKNTLPPPVLPPADQLPAVQLPSARLPPPLAHQELPQREHPYLYQQQQQQQQQLPNWGAAAKQGPTTTTQRSTAGGWITQGGSKASAKAAPTTNVKRDVKYPFMASSLAPSGGRMLWDQESPEEPSVLEEEYETKRAAAPVGRPAATGKKKPTTTTAAAKGKTNGTNARKGGKEIGQAPQNKAGGGGGKDADLAPGAISGQFKKVPIAIPAQAAPKPRNSLMPQEIEAKKRNDELDRTKDFLRTYQKKRAMAMSSSVPSSGLAASSLSSFSTPTVATTEIDPAVFKKTINLDENRFVRDEKHIDLLLQQSWNN